MTDLYPKVATADGFVFASPVYFGSMTGLMKSFMDRLLPFTTSYYHPNSESGFRETLRLRPAGAVAVGGARNDGTEATIYALHRCFLYHDMIPVGAQAIGNTYGISALGGAMFTEDKPNATARDSGGIDTVRILGKKVAVFAKALKTVRPVLEAERII
jgi:multimeric flavodoxin WrbA